MSALFGGQKVIHFLVADINSAINGTFLNPVDGNFIAQLLSQRRQIDATLVRILNHLRDSLLAALCHSFHGLGNFCVADAYPHVLRAIELQALQNKTFKNLWNEYRLRRNFCFTVFQSCIDVSYPLLQLAGHDYVIVNHGDNMVERYFFRACRQCPGKPQQEQAQANIRLTACTHNPAHMH